MSKSIDLKGKKALITGASRGIGAAVALAYARAGAHVILLARTVGALEEMDDKIRTAGGIATLIPQDLTRFEDVDKLGPILFDRFGGLDIFVGNAGMLGTLGPLVHTNPKEWQKTFDVNVTANFRLIRTLDPLLRAAPAGRVIVTGSSTAHRPKAYWGQYRITKAAVEMLVQTYAAETVQTNVRVNVIYPGPIETAILNEAYPGGYPDGDARGPEDVVPAFLELASDSLTRHGEIIQA